MAQKKPVRKIKPPAPVKPKKPSPNKGSVNLYGKVVPTTSIGISKSKMPTKKQAEDARGVVLDVASMLIPGAIGFRAGRAAAPAVKAVKGTGAVKKVAVPAKKAMGAKRAPSSRIQQSPSEAYRARAMEAIENQAAKQNLSRAEVNLLRRKVMERAVALKAKEAKKVRVAD